MRLLVVQQDHVSPPGPVGEAFADRGYDVEAFTVVPAASFDAPGVDVDLPDPLAYDAVVPMGAPWSVTDPGIAAWVTAELAMLRRAHAGGVPVLGICFGGQLLAAALGGSVARAPAPEIGWLPVDTDDGALVPAGPWFQWHQDRWTPPARARELARTPLASQAFVLGRSLAVQFHPELTAAQLGGWLANGGDAWLAGHGVDGDQLLARTQTEEPAARERTRALVGAFLDRVATAAPGLDSGA